MTIYQASESGYWIYSAEYFFLIDSDSIGHFTMLGANSRSVLTSCSPEETDALIREDR